MKILLLVDYRGQFYSSQRASTIGMDLEIIQESFQNSYFSLEICCFSKVNYLDNYANTYVVYQSSEDRGLLYKSYIADVILGLQERGATLVPRYVCFHAHHNKSFQEILRKNLKADGIEYTHSLSYGCFEEFTKNYQNDLSYPVVIKSSEGCKSKSVCLVNSEKELFAQLNRISSSFDLMDFIRFTAKRYLRKNYILESVKRNKFIIQEFVPNLEGDYKVLVYGDKYYILERKNRKNDFRASGSGLFNFPKKIPSEILDVSQRIKNYFNVPYISLDIAFDPISLKCYLIEFQFVMFGTFTLEYSDWYFQKKDEKWTLINKKSSLEKTFSESIINYLTVNTEA